MKKSIFNYNLNFMQALQFIREHCKCCISGQPLLNSKTINIMQLDYKAFWDYPVWGYMGTDIEGMAIAYLHDKSIVNGEIIGEVKYAVEMQGEKIIYHPISRLTKVEFNK